MSEESALPDFVDALATIAIPIADETYAQMRLGAAPGTPSRPAQRLGRPALEEPPQRVGFEPKSSLELRLEPDRELLGAARSHWRRKVDLLPCRLVWVGAVVASADVVPTPHVEALVLRSTGPGIELVLEARTFPISELPLVSVGRVLKEKPGPELARNDDYEGSRGAPGPEHVADLEKRLVTPSVNMI